MDVARIQGDGIFSQSELEKYLKLLNEAAFRLSLTFIPSAKKPEELKGYIGTFFLYVLTVKDFKEDIEEGFINFTREEIQKYNINANRILEDANLFLWLKEKFPEIMSLLLAESEILKDMPLIVKIIWLPSYFNLLWKLNRIKYYSYRFAVRFKKNYLKELISYIEAMINCIKFSLEVLIRNK